jgi:hypothetical protein
VVDSVTCFSDTPLLPRYFLKSGTGMNIASVFGTRPAISE